MNKNKKEPLAVKFTTRNAAPILQLHGAVNAVWWRGHQPGTLRMRPTAHKSHHGWKCKVEFEKRPSFDAVTVDENGPSVFQVYNRVRLQGVIPSRAKLREVAR